MTSSAARSCLKQPRSIRTSSGLVVKFHGEILLVCGDGETFLIDLPDDPVHYSNTVNSTPPLSPRTTDVDNDSALESEEVSAMVGFLSLDTVIPSIGPDILSPKFVIREKTDKQEKQRHREEKLQKLKDKEKQRRVQENQLVLEKLEKAKKKEERILIEMAEKQAKAKEKEEQTRKEIQAKAIEKEEKARAKELKIQEEKEEKRKLKNRKAEQEIQERHAREERAKEKKEQDELLRSKEEENMVLAALQTTKEIEIELVGQWTRPRAPTEIRDALEILGSACVSNSDAVFIAPDPIYSSLETGAYKQHKIVAEGEKTNQFEYLPDKSPDRKSNPLTSIKISKKGFIKKLAPKKSGNYTGGSFPSISPRKLPCNQTQNSVANGAVEVPSADQQTHSSDVLGVVKQKPLPKAQADVLKFYTRKNFQRLLSHQHPQHQHLAS